MRWRCILFSRAAKSSDSQQTGNDTAARHELFIAGVAQAMQRKESAGEGLAAMADGRNAVVVPEGNFWDDENYSVVLPHASIVG